ncbi:DUF3352 domain-containing protein [Oxynema sp. CENA135]|uniref:DUF3352 domain-containing protein n=1 Tax=Oxynema sp. CENA135 TaxID=984206 RepID=UPI00190B255C|nr:DUF3352 domain-containing protein [Oxynema sp. CENA135]
MNLDKGKKLVVNRTSLSILSAIALLPGVAVAQTPTVETPSPAVPKVAEVLPAQIGGLVLLNGDARVWDGLKRFVGLPPSFVGPGFLPYLPASVDFAATIQPALGDWVAIALMPPSTPESVATFEESPLMLAPLTETIAVEEIVDRIASTRESAVRRREYQGVTLFEWPEEELAIDEPTPSEAPGELELTPAPFKSSGAVKSPILKRLLPFGGAKGLQWPIAQAEPEPAPFPEENFPEADFPEEDFPEPPPPIVPPLAIAVSDGYLVAAPGAAPIERWLDSRQTGQPKLADDARFQRTIARPEFGRSLFVGYTDTDFLRRFNLAEVPELPPVPLPLPLPMPGSQGFNNALDRTADTYEAIDFAFWIDNNGLRARSTTAYRTPQPENASPPSLAALPSRLPASTYLALTSRGFDSLWNAIVPQPSTDPEAMPNWGTQFRAAVRQALNLDLDEDIIRWMDGEYGVFFFPSKRGLFPAVDPRLQFGIGLMVETSDRPAAESFFSTLESYIRDVSQDAVAIHTRQIDTDGVTHWQVTNEETGEVQSAFSYGWLDDNLLLVTTGIGPMEELNPKPYLSLEDSYTFQTATQPFPQPNDGYFYLNVGSTLAFVNNLFPQNQEGINPAFFITQILGNIRSLSLSTSGSESAKQTDFFLVISPRQ